VGECQKCGAELKVGTLAVYERHVGIFCQSCAPTDPEEIRGYRQGAGERRAEKYEEWAARRREKAEAVLKQNSTYTEDIAFLTQPGRIPIRDRIYAQNNRACENIATAKRFEEKARSLRRIRVVGDAERQRQTLRDAIRTRLRVGMAVDTCFYGRGVVEKINRKTATIGSTGRSGTYRTTVDLSFIVPLKEE